MARKKKNSDRQTAALTALLLTNAILQVVKSLIDIIHEIIKATT